MPHYDRVERTSPWIIVAVFLAGAMLVAGGIVVGSLVLALVGAVTVVAAGLGGVILPRVGLSAPMSFNEDFPESVGSDDSDAGDGPQEEERKIPEVPARKLPEGPDRDRAKPQYLNLGPHERLRAVGGEEVIEVPEEERGE